MRIPDPPPGKDHQNLYHLLQQIQNLFAQMPTALINEGNLIPQSHCQKVQREIKTIIEQL
jgi:hypothetical protein